MNGQTVTKVFAPLSGGATAVYTGAGLTYYRHPDWLGSSRVASTPTRTIYYDGAYAPFGEAYAEIGTTDRNFTGQNQELTPGATGDTYDFLYRDYQSIEGRWVSPDPAGMAAVDPANPQTWNRYVYVKNNPLDFIDFAGLDDEDCQWDPASNSLSCPGSDLGMAGAPRPAGGGGQDADPGGGGTRHSGGTASTASSSGLTKKQLACAADATINGALSIFVPGYAATKAVASFAGFSFNPIGALAGTSDLLSAGNPTAFQTASGLAGANSIYQDASFAAAGGASALIRVQALTNRAGFGLQTASRQSRLLSQLGNLTSLEGAASFASKANNITAGISAGYDIYKCVTTP